MKVQCDGCGAEAETTSRQGVGRTNPVNPRTGVRWWSRQVMVDGKRVLQHACSPECRQRVLAGVA